MKEHQSMEDFKQFIRRHTDLVKEVRRGIYTWQEIYEDWYLLGEDNPVWAEYRSGDASLLPAQAESQSQEEKEAVSSFFDSLKNVDVQAMQKHVSTLSQALGTISGVISQFQGSSNDKKDKETKPRRQPNPFPLRRD
ncbi:MAG: spore coat protein YlbD [Bacillus sp. (in: firmicutes)]